MIAELRAAAEALNRGDSAPFAALMADESEWRGPAHGQLWWKQTPACHGPEEARAALEAGLARRGGRPLEVHPELKQVGDDRIIAMTSWLAADGSRQQRFQVLTIGGGKIVDLQGCATLREAERFARRR